MKKIYTSVAMLLLTAGMASAQMEGPVRTEALIEVASKADQIPTLSDVRLKVNGKEAALSGWTAVPASGMQVAVLIDDGLRSTFGTELEAVKSFTRELPEGAQIFIGYMRNGSIETAQRFTSDHQAAVDNVRLPFGSAGISASPYFCLSEFVKHWPANSSRPGARFVLMITNGVDPYNGSTSITNQDSPYVNAAIRDAQRAGVSVSSIYFSNSGFGGGQASFSGQSYLGKVAQETGGHAYYQGTGNPVTIAPFLKQFRHALSQTYVASFVAPVSKEMFIRLQPESLQRGVKLRGPQYVQVGNLASSAAE